jgi:hypothetical protein
MKIAIKVYRSAMGKEIDMQTLMLQNEKTIALGNANLNARGDQVDARGNIIKRREDLAQDYYRSNPKAVRDEPLEEDKVVAEEAKVSKKTKASKELRVPIPTTISPSESAEFNDSDDAASIYANDIIKNKDK